MLVMILLGVIIIPAHSPPLKGMPRRAISAITGRCTSSTSWSARWSGMSGTGLTDPMPPVLGPVLPSPMGL